MAASVPKSVRASLYIDGKPAESSLKNVKQVTTTLRRELDGLTIGTEEWNKKLAQLQANERYLRNIRTEVNGTTDAFGRLSSEVGRFGSIAAGYLSFQFISSQFNDIIGGNAKLSDSLADMRRVLEMSEAAVINLDNSLGKLDTRTSKSGLRDIAIIGGKLGVAKDQILEFVKATDMLTVALGDELGNADQITTQLGKILNVFDGKVTGDNITRLGNAMVKLANDGVASAGFIADFSQRVSGIAKTAGMSLPATLAIGAGIEELGGRSESASTAIQKLLISMNQDLPGSARIAKVSVDEFNKMMSEAPEQALLKYTRGLVANKAAFSDVTQSLSDAGEEGARTVEVITKLGEKTEFFSGKITDSEKAITGYSYILDAFNLKNETLGAKVDKLGKDFKQLSENTTLISMLTSLILAISATVNWVARNSQAIGALVKMVIIAGTAWGTYRTYVLIANSALGTLIVGLVRGESVMALSRTATIALAGAKAILAGDTVKATQAFRLLNATMAANPIGAVIAAIVAIGMAFVAFSGQISNAAKIQQNFNDIQNETSKALAEEKNKIQALLGVLTDENAKRETKLAAVKKLRDLMPEHLKGYTDEQILAGKASTAILDYVDALKKRYQAEAAGRKLAELEGNINDIKTQVKKGYDEGATFKEKLLAPWQFEGNNKAGWKKMKDKEIADLEAQAKEVRENYNTSVKADLAKAAEAPPAAAAASIKTLESLKKKLQEITDEREKVKVGSKTFFELTKTMADLKKEIDSYDPKKATKNRQTEETEQKKALKEFESLDDQYKKLNLQRLNDQLSANEKEIKQESDKYDALIAKEKKFLSMKGITPEQTEKTNSNINQLEADKDRAVTDLRVRQETEMVQKIKELNVQLTGIHEGELQKQLNQINKFYDELETKNVGNAPVEKKLRLAREKEISDAILRAKEQFNQDLNKIGDTSDPTTDEDKLAKKLNDIRSSYETELEELKRKYGNQLELAEMYEQAKAKIEGKIREKQNQEVAKFKLEKEKANAAEIKDAALQSTQAVADATFSILSNNRSRESAIKLSAIEQDRANELSTKNLTEKQKAEINKKYDAQVKAEKLKAWEADRKAALGQAIINGALAVVKALPNLALSITSGIAAAAQIAVIASQKPPEFATGGFSDREPAGFVSKSTIFRNSASGRPFEAGEKGREWIAPNWMVKSPRFANIIGTLEAVRKQGRSYASGGFNGEATSSVSSISGSYDFTRLEKMMVMMIDAQRAANDKKVINVYSEWETFHNKILETRNDQSG